LGAQERAVPAELLTDRHGIAKQVDGTESQTGDLGPAEAEDRSEPHHRFRSGVDGFSQGEDVVHGEGRPAKRRDRGQPDVPARAAGDPIGADGVDEEGPYNVVLPVDGT